MSDALAGVGRRVLCHAYPDPANIRETELRAEMLPVNGANQWLGAVVPGCRSHNQRQITIICKLL